MFHLPPGVRAVIAVWGLCLLAASGAQAAVSPQSAPICLSKDAKRLLNCNPESNTVTVFDVTNPTTPVKLQEVAVFKDPVSVAIHPNGQFAYVTCAADNA